jgi:uncharacterized repeat protein (TIGR03847 family)
MSNFDTENDIELNPLDFITFGTVGPKGKRAFYLQAGRRDTTITLVLEKQQTKALGDAITELLDDLKTRYPIGAEGKVKLEEWNMDLRDPIEPLFRIAQIGLGYDENQNRVVIVAQELVIPDEEDEETDPLLTEERQPRLVRLWGTRAQFRALSMHAIRLVEKGRADPKSNGRLIYYWT